MSDEGENVSKNKEFLEQFKKLISDVSEIKAICQSTNANLGEVIKDVEQLKKSREQHHELLEGILRENYVLKMRINEIEQHSKKNNIIISGVPFEQNEKLRDIFVKIASKLGENVNDYDIGAIHRLYTKRGIPGIIVRMNDSEKKFNLVKQSKRMKIEGRNVGITPSYPIFIDEQMTQYNAELHRKALELRKSGVIKFVWHRNGKILVRRSEEEEAVRIQDIVQLEEMEEVAKRENQGEEDEVINESTRESGGSGKSEGSDTDEDVPNGKVDRRKKDEQGKRTRGKPAKNKQSQAKRKDQEKTPKRTNADSRKGYASSGIGRYLTRGMQHTK